LYDVVKISEIWGTPIKELKCSNIFLGVETVVKVQVQVEEKVGDEDRVVVLGEIQELNLDLGQVECAYVQIVVKSSLTRLDNAV
jgi:hypothetical protein